MTLETAQDLVRVWLRREGLSLARDRKVLSPMEEAVAIREIALLVADVKVTSPVRAEGSVTEAIKRVRWDQEPTDEVPEIVVMQLAEMTR